MTWSDARLDNSYIPDEFNLAFIKPVATGDDYAIATHREVPDHYLTTDPEANLALFYADQEVAFNLVMLDIPGAFTTTRS